MKDNVHIDYRLNEKLYHKQVAKLAAKYLKNNAKVLDYGCGLGHTLSNLETLNPSLKFYCCDAYENCLETTKSRVNITEARLVPEDGISTEGFEKDFDLVVLSHVLEHTRSPVETLSRLLEMLKPGGVLVVAVPNVAAPYNLLRLLFRRYNTNKGHVFAWDRGHWINMLETVGCFDVVEYSHDEAWLFPRTLSIKNPLKKFEVLIGDLVPGWCVSHIAVIRNSSKRNLPVGSEVP